MPGQLWTVSYTRAVLLPVIYHVNSHTRCVMLPCKFDDNSHIKTVLLPGKLWWQQSHWVILELFLLPFTFILGYPNVITQTFINIILPAACDDAWVSEDGTIIFFCKINIYVYVGLMTAHNNVRKIPVHTVCEMVPWSRVYGNNGTAFWQGIKHVFWITKPSLCSTNWHSFILTSCMTSEEVIPWTHFKLLHWTWKWPRALPV